MKKVLLSIILLFTYAVQAQIVNIPDSNFKNALVNGFVWDLDCDGKIMIPVDANDDGEIQVSEAEAVTCLRVQGFNITSMEGIESFSNLEVLSCQNNQITDIDVSQNLALTALQCQQNLISELDVTNNINLDRLDCFFNQLTELDLSQNAVLRTLLCSINQLTSIDVSQNPLLWIFSCNINQIESLDVSQNPNLRDLYCYDNRLTSLNIQNGNNTSMLFMQAEENPDLPCIQVDNEVYANNNTNWTKDATAVYSEDCLLGLNEIDQFRAVIFPNPVLDVLTIESQEIIISTEVFSTLGKLLASEENSYEINFSGYSAGWYIIKVNTEKGAIFQKVLKE